MLQDTENMNGRDWNMQRLFMVMNGKFEHYENDYITECVLQKK